jgi:hypothetical protein
MTLHSILVKLLRNQFTFPFFVALFFTSNAYAQKAIRLKYYNREIILAVEQRIKYKLTDGTVAVGRIQAITDDFFVVHDTEIRLDQLERIGRKGAGSNFAGIFLGTLGAMLTMSNFVQVVDPYDECISCPGQQAPAADGRDLLLSMSVTSAGFLILAANKTRNLQIWSIEIIERPDR